MVAASLPLTMHLLRPDNGPNEPIERAKWKYALDVSPDQAETKIKVVRNKTKQSWDWPLDAPIKLIADAKEFDWSPTITQPMPSEPLAEGRPAKITLVPYCCTKFHITIFPITERLAKDDSAKTKQTAGSREQL